MNFLSLGLGKYLSFILRNRFTGNSILGIFFFLSVLRTGHPSPFLSSWFLLKKSTDCFMEIPLYVASDFALDTSKKFSFFPSFLNMNLFILIGG